MEVHVQNGSLVQRLRHWAFDFGPDQWRVGRWARGLCRVLFIMESEFHGSFILLRASALTYTIVLSLVPLLAMSTAVLKGLGSGDMLRVAAYRFIEQLEPGAAAAPERGEKETANRGGTAQQAGHDELTRLLRQAVDTIFDYVDRTNFAALGAFGIIGLLIGVVLVLGSVEEAMNGIWHSEKGRPYLRKLIDYVALIFLFPLSVNAALAGEAILESPAMRHRLSAFIDSPWLLAMLFKLIPFAFVVLAILAMYLFFPNTRVKTYAAACGALFAGVFWFLTQRLYIVLQIGVTKHNAIYGSFASIPLFLVWVHLGWTFILLGALMAYAVQNRDRYRPASLPLTPKHRLQMAFDILRIVHHDFQRRHLTTEEELLRQLPGDFPAEIRQMLHLLASGGLVRTMYNGEITVVPSGPPETIRPETVVHLICGAESLPTPGGHLADRVVAAAREAVDLETFLQATPLKDEEK